MFGLKENRNNNTDTLVQAFAKEKFQVDISPDMMDKSHRVGRENNNNTYRVVFILN